MIFVYICLECSTGTYGPGCLDSCTGHCLNDKACNTTTGRCDAGCKPGYTGEKCDTGISKQCDICLFKPIFINFWTFTLENNKTSTAIIFYIDQRNEKVMINYKTNKY